MVIAVSSLSNQFSLTTIYWVTWWIMRQAGSSLKDRIYKSQGGGRVGPWLLGTQEWGKDKATSWVHSPAPAIPFTVFRILTIGCPSQEMYTLLPRTWSLSLSPAIPLLMSSSRLAPSLPWTSASKKHRGVESGMETEHNEQGGGAVRRMNAPLRRTLKFKQRNLDFFLKAIGSHEKISQRGRSGF